MSANPTAPSAGILILNVGVSTSVVCGVRDYAHALSAELQIRGINVCDEWGDLDGGRPGSGMASWLSSIGSAVASRRPDVVLLHYSVFSYSWKGVPLASLRMSARLRQLNIPVVAILHEFVYPWGQRGLRGLVHAITQRVALWPLVGLSTELLVTTPERLAWVTQRAWLPRRPTTFAPVFSNIGRGRTMPGMVPPNVVIFGYAADTVNCEAIAGAVAAAAEVVDGLGLVLVGGPGPHHVVSRRWSRAAQRAGCRLAFTGVVERESLSAVLSSASIALFPDSAGPTPRKGTLAALLSHGCPIIVFDGPETWRDLVESGAVVVVRPVSRDVADAIIGLLQDDEARTLLRLRAVAFYDSRMDIGRVAGAVITVITRTGTKQESMSVGQKGVRW